MREGTFVVNGSSGVERSSTEIVGKARRRQFSTSYIDQILNELDAASHGERGKILRREGLYAKQVSRWRQQRATGVRNRRGRKPGTGTDQQQGKARLERENARLRRKLMQAEKIIEVQKKVAELLGVVLPSDEER